MPFRILRKFRICIPNDSCNRRRSNVYFESGTVIFFDSFRKNYINVFLK